MLIYMYARSLNTTAIISLSISQAYCSIVKEVVTYLLRSDVIQWKFLEWTS